MGSILVRLLSICFLWMVFLPAACSLKCYECQERRAGDWCSQPKKQECNVATSVCLKYLHKEGKPGFPNHVIAKCELRSYYTQNKINACERSVRNRNGALTITETCTCDTDLCNDDTLNAAKMMELDTGGHKEPVTPATTEPSEDEEGDDEGSEKADAAVESPTPEVKDAEKSKSDEKSAEDNGSSKTIPAMSCMLALILHVVLFSLVYTY